MNIDKLHKGQIIKNYKELCLLLDEEVKGGKGKVYQLKELDRHVKYHKEGQKIIIDEIYQNPLEKESSKSNSGIMSRISQGEYSKEVFPLVKNFVAKNDIEYISKGKIMFNMGLVNSNYKIARTYAPKVAKFLSKELKIDITENDIRIITYAIYENANDKIHNAFKNLEKMNCISAYTNELLTTYNVQDYKEEVLSNIDGSLLEAIILGTKFQTLEFYYREKQREYKDFITYIDKLRKEYNNEEKKISKELNRLLFLNGMLDTVKESAIQTINVVAEISMGRTIDNYYYSYGYIRNEDKEWDKEIIDIAKENICLSNYKEKVKNSYLSKSFVNDFKSKSDIDVMTIEGLFKLEDLLTTHLGEFKEKSDILFDLFTQKNPKIVITSDKFVTEKVELLNNKDSQIPF